MKKSPPNKPAARSNSKKSRSKRLSPDEIITDALEQTRVSIEAAQSAANHLNARVLAHRIKLVPEATIVRESATLLQHVEQNFRHLALDQLNEDPCGYGKHRDALAPEHAQGSELASVLGESTITPTSDR